MGNGKMSTDKQQSCSVVGGHWKNVNRQTTVVFSVWWALEKCQQTNNSRVHWLMGIGKMSTDKQQSCSLVDGQWKNANRQTTVVFSG